MKKIQNIHSKMISRSLKNQVLHQTVSCLAAAMYTDLASFFNAEVWHNFLKLKKNCAHQLSQKIFFLH